MALQKPVYDNFPADDRISSVRVSDIANDVVVIYASSDKPYTYTTADVSAFESLIIERIDGDGLVFDLLQEKVADGTLIPSPSDSGRPAPGVTETFDKATDWTISYVNDHVL